MTDILVIIFSTMGTLLVLLAAIGVLRMPDLFLRMSVTTKAASLGIGMLLASAAVYFNSDPITTRVLAIIFFLLLTAPVGAHLIGRASYFVNTPLWDKTTIDELKGQYDEHTHECQSGFEGEDDDSAQINNSD